MLILRNVEMSFCNLFSSCTLHALHAYVFITQDDSLLKVWFKQDDTFNLPKACLLFEITRYLLWEYYLLVKINWLTIFKGRIRSAHVLGSNVTYVLHTARISNVECVLCIHHFLPSSLYNHAWSCFERVNI